jgi:eukaryotic-like serine/threonine-protein kinase
MTERPIPASHRALVGQLIDGKYEVRSIIGSGGMGTVFEAKHVAIGRIVAIKALHPSQIDNATAVKRFHQEAWAAGSIGHPSLCEVYDVGLLPDRGPFIVMERLWGVTMAERLQQALRLPIREAVATIMHVLAGLDAVHERGIIHRDIKPENVFLAERKNQPLAVKVLDFGVSKVIAGGNNANEWDERSALTQTGIVMGTPYYVSPEQARALRDVDARTDLYSCGVVLYEALTGEIPYEANNFHALLLRILQGNPRSPREIRDEIPPELEAVIAKAMAADREQRYGTAREMSRALAPFVKT